MVLKSLNAPILVEMHMYGDSMSPTINNSAIGLFEPTTENTKLKINDMVVFKDSKSPVGKTLHRIVDIKDGYYYIKGDNVDLRFGDIINKSDILFKLVKVEKFEGDS